MTAKSHSVRRRLALVTLLLSLSAACGVRPSVEATGRAGRDIHDPSAQVVQDQFLIEYTLKNTASDEFVFDRVEERWSPTGEHGGLTQTVLPKGGPWRIAGGHAKTFVSGTNGYTLQLDAAARGRPIAFSFTLYNGTAAVLGPLTAVLPELRTLPRVDQHILSLKHTDNPLPRKLADLPSQAMQPIQFTRK
jgi:hypothetical protein